MHSWSLRMEETFGREKRFQKVKFKRKRDLEVVFNTIEEEVHNLLYKLGTFNMCLIIAFDCLAVNMSS